MDSKKEPSNGELPWVTFCMTTYKRPDFLKKQLKAILGQTFSAFRVIVSDNDVAASGKNVVEEFNDPRISYFTNEVNLGMIKSFNRSLSKAKTEYVLMITDDDPIYPDSLQILYDLSIQVPGYGMYMGGSDILCYNPMVARSSRLKVGTNSCLADLPIGTIRTFTGEEFPFAYFKNEFGGNLLWSSGVVRREIALEMGGLPDYGAPYNADFAYIVLSGSYSGAVLINTSLGSQVVHGANYGFTESDFEKFYLTPEGFQQWLLDHLPKKYDYSKLPDIIKTFLGRWVVEYAVSIKKTLRAKNIQDQNFENYTRKIFRIPYLRKWRWKYLLAIHFPILFESLIRLKLKIFRKQRPLE